MQQGAGGQARGSKHLRGLAWGPGAHPQTCLDRQLTTKGVVWLQCAPLLGTPGNPRLGVTLAENQDPSRPPHPHVPSAPRQHPSIPASPRPPRLEPPPHWAQKKLRPRQLPAPDAAVPSSLGCGPGSPLSPFPGAPHSRHHGAGTLHPRTCHTDPPPGCLPALTPEALKRTAGRGRLLRRGEAQLLAFHLMGGPPLSLPKLLKL